ncbi:MAG: hypothetical protein DRP85_00630 [Candidatus Makaraimicrobium thalassicum]|nr:MAG: hypothetical protein DRP85_00630 [Candidatus Omnitrophota bacterium]
MRFVKAIAFFDAKTDKDIVAIAKIAKETGIPSFARDGYVEVHFNFRNRFDHKRIRRIMRITRKNKVFCVVHPDGDAIPCTMVKKKGMGIFKES